MPVPKMSPTMKSSRSLAPHHPSQLRLRCRALRTSVGMTAPWSSLPRWQISSVPCSVARWHAMAGSARDHRHRAPWSACSKFAFACNCKHTGGVKVVKPPNLGGQLGSLGEFIAGQRRAAELTLRQLAEQAGVSNPYLSQIERGLRRPSAEVLQQLARALRVSAETLYVRAGILDAEDHPNAGVEMAVLADTSITERQKRVLIDIYASFVKENAAAAEPPSNRKKQTTKKAGTASRGPA